MNWRSLFSILLGAIVLALLSHRAAGQDSANLRGESAQTRKRLTEAEQKLLSGKHSDATDDLQRVLDEAGDDLISVDGKQYRSARWIAHGILSRLPEPALKSYQDRIDDPARKLLAAAKRTNDTAPLWDLLDRYFVSRPADEGLLLLGDLLFERGEHREAEKTWQRLLPEGSADVVYPGSRLDPAVVRARIVLAIIYQNDLERAARELIAFRKRHTGASGPFAGKTGQFADTLQGWLDHPPAVAPIARAGTNWPTIGGGVDRTSHTAALLSGEWPAQPTWQVKLDSVERHDEAPSGPPRRPPFSHPVIVRGHVYVNDGSTVLGFHLLSGRRIPPLELASAPKLASGKIPPPDPCPTLSADGDRLYVRVGPGVIKSVKGKEDEETAIACVRIVSNADGACRLKEVWRTRPPRAEEGSLSIWEGAPLVSGRRMWAAFARFEGGRIVHAVACYDPNDASSAPDRPSWTTDLCDGPIGGGEGRARHELLTLAGRHIVFCSNTGALIALDAATGRRTWGYRYPRSRQTDAAQSPHPTPVVSSAGRLFVSPSDGDAIYALDPESGRVLWQSGPMTGARILGVSAGRVIVTVEGLVRGIRALSAETGSFQPPVGWIHHDSAGVLGYGQGLVAEDIIVWPTRSGLLFLRSDDGIPLGDSRPSPLVDANSNYFGNVVSADGVLVVVGPTAAWAYVSQAREHGPPSPRSDRDPARIEFERVIVDAECALARGEPAMARHLLLGASLGKLPAHYRAWAAARLVLLKRTGQRGLPADVDAAVAPGLRNEWLFGPDGVPISLGELIDRHLRPNSPNRSPHVPPKPCRREAAESPTLNPGSDIVQTIGLPPGSAPLQWIPGSEARPSRLFVATAEELLAVPLKRGDLTRFASPDRFTCAAELGDGFVAAGPSAVAVFGLERTPHWVFRVPMTEVVPARPASAPVFVGREPAVPALSSFHLNGTWLFARLGERHLIALDLRGKQVAWVLGADETSGFHHGAWPGSRRIGPTFGVTARHLPVQLSDGRRWLVATESGRIVASTEPGDRTAKVWWRQRPVEVAPNVVALPDGPDLVRIIELASGIEKWKHRVDGESSLTGDPPQVAVWPNAFLFAVRRNHGVELDRLNPADGESVWTGGPAFLDADDVTLANADADSERIIVPQGNSLSAISLETGRSLWHAKLPETRNGLGWRVRIGRACVIAYPEAAIPREPVADVLGRLRRSFESEPALWRLPLVLGGAYDAWVVRSVPVVLLDPENGRRLVRFDIPARGPAITACFEGDHAVVATGDRVVWLR